MLGRVVVENGVKKIVPLTADCGSGNPVGTVIAVYSNKVPNGYLPCNGVQFDTAQFPVLYALLGDDHTPDLRECTLVGIGRSDRTMGNHDEYTVGQFKDDQSQKITGRYNATGAFGSLEGAFVQTAPFEYANGVARSGTQWSSINFDSSNIVRTGTTTHGKQVGVNWCIKATSGINENQADNVLSALSPVDVVALNNVHSVTSNAVAEAFEWESIPSDKVHFTIDVSGSTFTAFDVLFLHCFRCKNLLKFAFSIVPREEIPEPSGNGNLRFYIQIDGIVPSSVLTNITTLSYLGKRIFPISIAYSSSITPNGWRVTIRYNESVSTSAFSSYFIIPI